MPAPSDLSQVCLNKQPVYFNEPSFAWEQRLASAYDEAALHLKKTLPPGSTIDAAQYELANDLTGNQIDTYGGDWKNRIASDQDADVSAALNLPADQCRQFYLGKFAQASSNLGAYLSGYAREQVAVGALSKEEFDKGAEVRLRQFSEIIHLGRTGGLPAAVSGEQLSQSKLGKPNATIVVATPGVTVAQPAAVSGLGYAIGAGGIALIVLAAGAVIAGGIVAYYWSTTSQSNRRAMLEICQDAVRRGDPRAEQICLNMSKVVADMASVTNLPTPLDAIVSREQQKQLVTYAVAGFGAYLLVPEIIRSLRQSKSAMTEKAIANLARAHRRYAGSR